MHGIASFSSRQSLAAWFVAILPLRYVTSYAEVAFARMGGVYTAPLISFLISFLFKVEKVILLLRTCGLCLVRICLVWT